MAIGPGSRVGPYEITALIGEGGMGKVWRARHTALKRDDALKMLPDAFAADRERLARFQREAQVLASLNHPNIAHVYGLEEVDGTKALVLELVEGPTLAERIAQGPIPVDEALLIARQIAEALEAAHEQGIIHRDLKPANVKVRSDGTVKVLDFGLAKLVESHGAAGASAVAGALLSQSPTITNPAMMTGVGMILGTAAYMSPEQARGKEVDKRADIWAFGVVLYEMLTGERPFTGEDVGETLAAVIKEQPEWHRVPAHVRPLLESCLEKDPRKRLRDIGDAWRLLENAGEDSASRSVRPQSSSRLPWGLAAAATLAFAGMTAYVLTRPAPASPSTQFTLEAPPSTIGFRFEVTGASVSPDGQLLVFSAFEGAERNSLYLRRLDSLEATPLPGTTNADFPFWSPDGRSIGFFADGNLKRIGIAGGPPVVLCEANGPGGGTWNRDGVIVFAARQGLFRVPASGGAPSALIAYDESGEGRGHPQFLPDGDHFLYFSGGSDADARGVYASSLARPQERVQILRASYKAMYAPPVAGEPGRLLFLRDTTLMTQPFDIQALQLEGEPARIADDVMVLPNSQSAAFYVADAGVLIYRTGAITAERSKLIWVGRGGNRLGEAAPEDAYSSMRMSPDGTRAVVGRRNAARLDDQWVLEFARGLMSRLTFDAARETWPVWSPDGTEIMFAANPTGTYQLYRKAASGAGDEEQLTMGLGKIPSDWSRDGRLVLYTELGPNTNDDIWALPLDGDRTPRVVLQTPFDEFDGQFSSDGKWIAYVSNESGRSEVYVQAFPPSGGKWQVSTTGGRAPRWRADGRELFYYKDDSESVMAVDVRLSAGRIEVGRASQLFSLAMPGGVASPYDVTADGRRFLAQELVPQTERPPLTVVTNWQAALPR